MPKKRVSVTLRKPASPAPDVASAPKLADTSAAESTVIRAADVPPEPASVEAFVSGAVEGAVLRAADVPLEPATVEAVVTGAAAALERAATEIPAPQLETVLKRGPEGYRELTIYLPEKLAEALSVHCLQRNLDMSRLIATAVEQLLRLADPAPGDAAPEKQSKRSRLLGLAGWVRTFLASRRPTWLLGTASAH